jgi:hypothetical protein
MDALQITPIHPVLEAGTVIVVQYCPPARTVARVTRTIDLQAHARAFAKTYRAGLAAGQPDLHDGWVGDAWAAELILSGILQPFCDSEEPCDAHADWMTEEHDYDYTLNIYPPGARLGGKGAPY